jgi:cytochrome b561
LQLENSANRYGLVAQLLHAIMAMLFIGSFAAVYGLQWFSTADTPASLALLQLHLSFGLSVLLLAILRLWWRLRSRVQPDELPGSRVEHLAARIVHGLHQQHQRYMR